MTNYPPMSPASDGGPSAQPARPPSVSLARTLMFVRAGFGLLSLILLFVLKNDLRDAVRKKNPDFDASKLDTAVNAAVLIGAVIGAAALILYVLLALQVGKGRRWAWIVTIILAGLGVLSAVSSAVQTAPALSKVVAVLAGLVDLSIFVLLLQGSSKPYFNRA